MARNVSRQKQEQNPNVGPPMVGGTLGVIEKVKTKLAALPRELLVKRPVDDPGAKRARQYRVVGGPYVVMYKSCKTRITPGKILSDSSCDVELLQRQGVVMQEIQPPAPPPPKVEEVVHAAKVVRVVDTEDPTPDDEPEDEN